METLTQNLLKEQNVLTGLMSKDLECTELVNDSEIKKSIQNIIKIYCQLFEYPETKFLKGDPSTSNLLGVVIFKYLDKKKYELVDWYIELLKQYQFIEIANQVVTRKQMSQLFAEIEKSRQANEVVQFLAGINAFFSLLEPVKNDPLYINDQLVELINQIMLSKYILPVDDFNKAIQILEAQGELNCHPVMIVAINALRVSWHLISPIQAQQIVGALKIEVPKLVRSVLDNFHSIDQSSNGLLRLLFRKFLQEASELAIFFLPEHEVIELFNKKYSEEQGYYAKTLDYLATNILLFHRYGERYINQLIRLCNNYISVWNECFPDKQANEYYKNQYAGTIGILSQTHIHIGKQPKELMYVNSLCHQEFNTKLYMSVELLIIQKYQGNIYANEYIKKNRGVFEKILPAAILNYQIADEKDKKEINSPVNKALIAWVRENQNQFQFILNFINEITRLNVDNDPNTKYRIFIELLKLINELDSSLNGLITNPHSISDYITVFGIRNARVHLKILLFRDLHIDTKMVTTLQKVIESYQPEYDDILNELRQLSLNQILVHEIVNKYKMFLNIIHEKLFSCNVFFSKNNDTKTNHKNKQKQLLKEIYHDLLEAIDQDTTDYFYSLIRAC